jgi:hypothetical protein
MTGRDNMDNPIRVTIEQDNTRVDITLIHVGFNDDMKKVYSINGDSEQLTIENAMARCAYIFGRNNTKTSCYY